MNMRNENAALPSLSIVLRIGLRGMDPFPAAAAATLPYKGVMRFSGAVAWRRLDIDSAFTRAR